MQQEEVKETNEREKNVSKAFVVADCMKGSPDFVYINLSLHQDVIDTKNK